MHSARSKRKGSAEEAWEKAWTLSSAHRSKQKTRANQKMQDICLEASM